MEFCQLEFTYTLFLPLGICIGNHALHAMLYAPPVCQLFLQLLLPSLQLLLK